MSEPVQSTKRVVWVLGAGFSKPLGGPMLADLLSPASESDAQFRYPEHRFPRLHGGTARSVRNLYQLGRADGPVFLSTKGPEVRGEKMWSNAEDFVDYIDTAAAATKGDSEHWLALRISRILQDIPNCVGGSPDKLRATARRLIAAECCGFLEGGPDIVQREKWRPFHRWARLLRGGEDTVISFNYDRVVEMLRDEHNRAATTDVSPLRVLVPSQMEKPADWKDSCPVLKLHGSVDWWARDNNGTDVVEPSNDALMALTCNDDRLAIATPGPSKQNDADRLFKKLWDEAKTKLAEADSVVFVGYRFPETDAHAREQLLNAIQSNHEGEVRHHLTIHVVLGQDEKASKRLEALLEFVCKAAERSRGYLGENSRTYEVKIHPLFAEDFFTVTTRSRLFGFFD